MDGGTDGGAEGDVKEDEISHGEIKPKAAGRSGGMDAEEKSGMKGLEVDGDTGRGSPRVVGSSGVRIFSV